jgi:GDP-4-dehydro-6-deoxy-D-mannose reductase
MGGLHVLEAVRASFPSIPVLIISSGEVYGMPAAGKMPVDESALLDPHTPYSVSKACVDMLAQQYRSTFRMNVVVARSFNHLGPGQNDMFAGSSFAKQIIEAKLGRREKTIAVGNLENKRDFTDVRDVVRAYVALLSKKLDHAVFNVCSGRPVALREVLDTLIRISGVKMKVTQDPTRIRSVDNPLMYGTAARLTDATGWKPEIPLEKTLADLLAYWETRLKA